MVAQTGGAGVMSLAADYLRDVDLQDGRAIPRDPAQYVGGPAHHGFRGLGDE